MKKRLLGIETSCDETAVAILEVDNKERRVCVKKHLVSSQIPIHRQYGGVVPEIAARSHVIDLVRLLDEMKIYGKRGSLSYDAIAVTVGPGLSIALRVGVEAAKAISFAMNKPLVAVNHLEGHLASAWLNAENRRQWKFPLLALVVSGGHTELVLMKDFCRYTVIGRTRDDAAGEAFDKTAKLIGLSYPGGPKIARLAKDGNPQAFDFPRPMMKDVSFDFSFSGLKTSVRQTHERNCKLSTISYQLSDLAASLQQAIIDILVTKTVRAAKQYRVNGVLLVGGVSANTELRRQMKERLQLDLPKVRFLPSDPAFVTDNAAMIAAAGFWQWSKGRTMDWRRIKVKPELNLGIGVRSPIDPIGRIGPTRAWEKEAKQLVASLHSGMILALFGPLGAGKTTFCQTLARILGSRKNLVSPSFALVRTYAIPPASHGITRLVHVDAYRIIKSSDMLALNLDEELSQPGTLLVVEWPERMKEWMQAHQAKVQWLEFRMGEDGAREITQLFSSSNM